MENNEIIMDNMDVMDEVIEVIPEKPAVNFGKIGFGIAVACAVVALGYKGYKLIKEKKAKEAQAAENVVDVDAEDFEYEESAE